METLAQHSSAPRRKPVEEENDNDSASSSSGASPAVPTANGAPSRSGLRRGSAMRLGTLSSSPSIGEEHQGEPEERPRSRSQSGTPRPSNPPSTVQEGPPPSINPNGALRFASLLEPQENFHKDEGGKQNQLVFRIVLQGQLTPELQEMVTRSDGIVPLEVKAVFDDGEPVDEDDLLQIMGPSEGGVHSQDPPWVSLRTRLGGVRYRFTQVSKRLQNRALSVVVSIPGLEKSISPITSQPTMVFSKRKNREQRLEEQAKERTEFEERQRAASALLSARAGSPPLGGEASAESSENSPADGPEANIASLKLPAPFVSLPSVSASSHGPLSVRSATKSSGPGARSSATGAVNRRNSRDVRQDSDNELDIDDETVDGHQSNNNNDRRKRAKSFGQFTATGSIGTPSSMSVLLAAGNSAGKSWPGTAVYPTPRATSLSMMSPTGSIPGLTSSQGNLQARVSYLENKIFSLEKSLSDQTKEVEEMRAAMHLMYAKSSGQPTFRRNVSQSMQWGSSGSTGEFDAPEGAGNPSGYPQPARSPFEFDNILAGSGSSSSATANNNNAGGAGGNGLPGLVIGTGSNSSMPIGGIASSPMYFTGLSHGTFPTSSPTGASMVQSPFGQGFGGGQSSQQQQSAARSLPSIVVPTSISNNITSTGNGTPVPSLFSPTGGAPTAVQGSPPLPTASPPALASPAVFRRDITVPPTAAALPSPTAAAAQGVVSATPAPIASVSPSPPPSAEVQPSPTAELPPTSATAFSGMEPLPSPSGPRRTPSSSSYT